MKAPKGHLDVSIVALDLDDTLITSRCEITERTVRVVQKLAEKGIYTVLCSGRARNGILPYVKKLGISDAEEGRFIISFNGATLFDLHRKMPIYENKIKKDVLKYVYHEAIRRGMPALVYDASTVYSYVDSKWARFDAELCHLDFKIVSCYERFLERGFPKMLVPSSEEKVSEFAEFLKANLKGEADIYISKPFFLEVMSSGVGKGEAVVWLADFLGIPHNKTLGFGDSMNDESMIKKLKYSVAMQNALPYIKEKATFETEFSNDHDGVAHFLEKYVL